jgi:hypothetical protein
MFMRFLRSYKWRDIERAWFVPCPLATHPVAVLISFAWLRKVPHCVVAVAA